MAETQARYEAASPEWVAAYRDFLQRELVGETFEGHNVTMSYEMTNPPPRLLRDGRKSVGWHVRIADGKCELGDHPLPKADLMLVADYETEAAILRMTNAEHTEYMRKHRAEIIAAGKFRVTGDPTRIPKAFERVNVRDRFYVPFTA